MRIASTTWAVASPCFRRPENQPVWCPFGIVLVGLGHVGGHRAVAPPEGRPLVTGHPSALMEDFDDLRTEARLELLLDEGIRHGIVVPIDFHVIIDVHADQFPLGVLIQLGGQRSEGGTVQGLEHALAGAREFFEGPLIQGHEQIGDRPVQLAEGEAGVVAEAGENPSFHHLHADLDFGFIPRTGCAGRDDRDVIVLRGLGVGPVERGLIAMGPAHGGLEIIRDHDLGHPTQCCEGADMRPDPIGQTLAPGSFGKGIVGSTQDGDEDRRLADFTGEGIDDRHRLAGVIDKECLTRPVALPHDQVELPGPLTIRLTKLTVLEAIGGAGLVFLPQQEQGDPLAFEPPGGRWSSRGEGASRWVCGRPSQTAVAPRRYHRGYPAGARTALLPAPAARTRPQWVD